MQAENDNVVHVEHLNKTFYSIHGYWRQKKYPVQAVKDISFSICKGELFGMVGPNGAGKTRMVKMLPTGDKATKNTCNVVSMSCR